jgi:glutathione S-transferase
MKIYGDMISPFVRMTLVMAHEAGVSDRVEHVRESVKPTESNSKLTKLSPIGKIPVLETDHHHPLYDSRVIMEYLAHVGGNSTLIPDDGVKRFRVLTLLALGQGLAEAAVGLRYETAARPQGLQWKDWIERTHKRITAACDDADRNWVADLEGITAGTVALACVLAYLDLRHPGIAWREARPALAAFLERFARRPSMMAYPLPKP